MLTARALPVGTYGTAVLELSEGGRAPLCRAELCVGAACHQPELEAVVERACQNLPARARLEGRDRGSATPLRCRPRGTHRPPPRRCARPVAPSTRAMQRAARSAARWRVAGGRTFSGMRFSVWRLHDSAGAKTLRRQACGRAASARNRARAASQRCGPRAAERAPSDEGSAAVPQRAPLTAVMRACACYRLSVPVISIISTPYCDYSYPPIPNIRTVRAT